MGLGLIYSIEHSRCLSLNPRYGLVEKIMKLSQKSMTFKFIGLA
jgi:hypothetical protein